MHFRITPLEERIVLDAAGAQEIVNSYHLESISLGSSTSSSGTGEVHLASDSTSSQADPNAATNDGKVAPQGDASSPDHADEGVHVLVVATQVADSHILADAAKDQTHVILYDASKTTLQDLANQISVSLQGKQADSIAFINEGIGATGQFALTNGVVVNQQSLDTNTGLQAFWQQVGSMIKDGGRVDLLACNIGNTASGMSVLTAIDTMVDSTDHHVNIAASTNLTGSSALGGDWTLELGNVDAQATYFTSDVLNWSHTLTNQSPVAVDDFYHLPTNDFIFYSKYGGFLQNDTDAEGDHLTIQPLSGTQHGKITLLGGIEGGFQYVPNDGFSGTDSFTYRAYDGFSYSNIATVTFTVAATDAAPSILPHTYVMPYTGSDYVVDAAHGLLVGASDPEGNPIEIGDADFYAIGSNNTSVLLEGLGGYGLLTIRFDGSFTYHQYTDPEADRIFSPGLHEGSGRDLFLVGSWDGVQSSEEQLLNFSVLRGFDDTYSTTEDHTLVSNKGVLANDYYSATSAVVVSGTSHGDLVMNANGTFAYTPYQDFNGVDSFIYRPSLNGVEGNDTLVTINVAGTPDSPVANADNFFLGHTQNTFSGNVLGNDYNPDQLQMHAILLSTGTGGTVTLLDDGSFSADLTGSSSMTFTYKVSYLNGYESGPATVTLTRSNQAPTTGLGGDFFNVSANGILSVSAPGPLLGDSDSDGDVMSAVLVNSTHNGTLSLSANGAFTYTPNLDFIGTDSFTYYAADPFGLHSNPATVTITVNDNQQLDINPDQISIAEDSGSHTISVFDNDHSNVGGSLTLDFSNPIASGPSHGTLTPLSFGNGTFTYTPDANFHGVDSFVYNVNNGNFVSAQGFVQINVENVNDVPVGQSDSIHVTENTPYSFAVSDLTANDSDADGATPYFGNLSQPSHGTISYDSGMLTYTPTAGYTGSDSFTYQLIDGYAASGSAFIFSAPITVNVTIDNVANPTLPTNVAPVAVNDTIVISEDSSIFPVAGPFLYLNVLQNDYDLDGATHDTLTVTLVDGPSHGTLDTTLFTSGNYKYTPNSDFSGTDTFAYYVTDALGHTSDIATVSIIVTPINDAPVVAPLTFNTNEDVALTVPFSQLLTFVSDDSSNTLISVQQTSNPSHGSVTMTTSGSFTYTPNANYNGSDSFNITISDGEFNVVKTVNITVDSVNDAPTNISIDHSSIAENSSNGTVVGSLSTTDVDSSSFTYTLLDNAQGRFAISGSNVVVADGSLLDYESATSHSIIVQVSDGSNLFEKTFTIDVLDVASSANNDSYTVNEDGTLNVAVPGLLANDSDASGAIAELVTAPSHGSISFGADGSFIYAPDLNYNGLDSFIYQIHTGSTVSGQATVNISITPVQDAPVANDVLVSGTEDNSIVGNIDASDPDNDSFTASVVDGPAHGSVVMQSGGSFTYTPDHDFFGSDSFTYKVNDGSDSNVAQIIINVSGVNDAPVANPDTVTTNEDTAITFDIRSNDTDVDSSINGSFTPGQGTVVIQSFTQPSNGALILNEDGTFTYTPNANYNGSDSFSYTISDGEFTSSSSVSITINPVNDAPVASNVSVSGNEDNTISGSISATDVDFDSLTAHLVTGPAHGSVALDSGGGFTYTPNQDYFGSDSFTYKVNDGTVDSNVATVSITIAAVNDAPVANPDTVTTNEDTAITFDARANDTDVDSSISIDSFGQPAHGVVVLNGNGTFTYTPDANYNGSDSFSYVITDGALTSSSSVSITINPVNDAPVASNVSASGSEDNPIYGSISATDVDFDPLTAHLVTGPAHGSVALDSGGGFVYTPNQDYFGSDSFTYKVNDGTVDSNIATVSITIAAVNDAPIANPDTITTNEDTAITFDARANDTDVDSSISIDSFGQPNHGVVVLNGDGTFTYTPEANYNGNDSFNYTITDGALTSSSSVSITINPVNDAPVASNVSASGSEDNPIYGSISATDVDFDPLTAHLVTGPAHGSVALDSGGGFVYTPNQDYFGSDSFTYKVNDGTVDSNVATVSITIDPVNDAPVANPDTVTTNEDTAITFDALANDTDIDSSISIDSFGQPNHGVVVLNGDGTFTYTPEANYNGNDSFNYVITDGALTSSTTVSITVNAVNDAPVASNVSASGSEDNPIYGSISATDVDFDPLTAHLVTGPAHGSVALDSSGFFTYTPNQDYFGSDSFTYKVNDGTVDSNIATVSITIAAVNDAPVANPDTVTTSEGNPVTFDVRTNDTDVDSTFTFDSFSQPSNGVVVLNGDGTFTYTPNANFNGSDSFNYVITDGEFSSFATVSITVNAVNEAPVANPDSVTTDEDTAVTFDARANDTDSDSSIAVDSFTQPSHGVVVLNGDGTFTYTPNANFNGSDSFGYTITDGQYTSSSTVSITINPVNDAPVAVADSVTTNEDTAVTFDVRTNDSDVDSAFSIDSFSQPAHGSVVQNGDGTFTYTPAANYNGSDIFSYTITDGQYTSSTTVSITVNAVNDAPVANADSITTNEDTAITFDARANDTDVDSSIAIDSVTQPGHGSVVVNGNGTFTYTPAANYNGSDSFSYTITDGQYTSSSTVSITINPVNDAPVAVADSVTTSEDIPVTFDARTNDSDIDSAFSINSFSQPGHGVVVLNGDGTFTYTPAPNYNGSDSFSYNITDGQFGSSATVSITVTAVNDNPVANNDSATTNEDTAVLIPVKANDTDVDGDSLTVISTTAPSHGSATIQTGGIVQYIPLANYNGSDSFNYTISDGHGGFSTAAVTVTIAPVNDAPVASNVSVSGNEDTAIAGSISASDIDSAVLTPSIVTGPSHGSVVLNADGSFVYTPASNYNGPDSFNYRVNDGSLNSNTATVSITVAAVNDAPVASNVSASGNEDTAISGSISATDVDNAVLTPSIVTGPAHGSVILNANGTFTYNPATNYNGPDSFTYKVNDGSLDSNTATVSITIAAVNDAPVASNVSVSGNEDTAIAGSISATDVDSAVLTPSVVAAPAHGSVTLNADGSFIYNPAANYNGSDSFTYRVNDGQLNSNVATVSISVASVNDAPTDITLTNNSIPENQPSGTSIGTLAAIDPDTGDPHSFSLVSGYGDNSQFQIVGSTLKSNASFDYESQTSYTIQVRTTDSGGLSVDKVFTINITDVNENANTAPVATNDAYSYSQDVSSPTTLVANALNGVLANDTDANGDHLTAVLLSGPAHGTLTFASDGSFTYKSFNGFSGTDSFTYRANDGSLNSNTATALIDINANPIIKGNADKRHYTENKDPVILNTNMKVTDQDTPVFNGGTLTVTITANGTSSDVISIVNSMDVTTSGNNVYQHGVLVGTFTGGNGTTPLVITFNSAATNDAVTDVSRSIGFSNSSDNPSTADRTVTLRLSDGEGGLSNIIEKTVIVTSVNDAPNIDTTTNAVTLQRNTWTTISGVSVTDPDSTQFSVMLQVNRGVLKFSDMSGLGNLTFDVMPGENGLGTLEFSGSLSDVNLALSRILYMSKFNFIGKDVLTIKVVDNGGSIRGGIDKDIAKIALSITVQ